MALTQDTPLVAIDTPLGKDKLVLDSLRGAEALSRPFCFHLRLLSEDHAIAFDRIVGERVCVAVYGPQASRDQQPEPVRYISGYIRQFGHSGRNERYSFYRATLVPWLWLLKNTVRCRIFQDKTAPQIVKQIFKERGFGDFEESLQGQYEPIEYCVQYRESDFRFVSRLLEHFGIFYFFKHEKDKHTLVLADSPSAYPNCGSQHEFAYLRDARPAFDSKKSGVIANLRLRQRLRPGKVMLSDYNFETPAQSLAVMAAGTVRLAGNDRMEVFDYPGSFGKRAQGEQLAKVRMQELESRHLLLRGVSTGRTMIAGHKFELTGHGRSELNKAHLLVRVRHSASNGDLGRKPAGYLARFFGIPAKTAFRPARVTEKPIITGPQTAVVVGKAGSEIFTDKHGRIKVQFHWDREGQCDEKSSCWIRVAQSMAGKGWGAQFIPRVGQEVVVEFLEGDPDRPLITGVVYNGTEVPAYPPDQHPTISTMKSCSSKGAGGFNELRFEDDKGKEQVFIHAERDLDLRIKNDRREWVGDAQHVIVKKLRNEEVGEQYFVKVGKEMVLDVGSALTLRVGGNFIKIDESAIHIRGKMVYVNTDGAEPGKIPEAPKEADASAKAGAVDTLPKRRY